ncbi:glycosyl hydrolase family 95 catalytic domain-containing protein [Sphingobacterium sp. xlx-130]|uniref:glycosyl hydrolase family 95 catalytic domain-containing protein n=1 Tax=Sphingobacterium sp. xlx-130 TaxID=2654323 RepID=UPI0013DC5A5B|nr:glycoside hydrolase N-terminal domain-containing protein [Sphingobacterium sp. xlx-130]
MREFFLVVIIWIYCLPTSAQKAKEHHLTFDHLASRWDEAIPLGNGMLGALVWQKENTLRFSLDRADLWDERKAFNIEEHDFNWVVQQVKKNDYSEVHQWGDRPYDASPYPTKLPAAALTFDLKALGKVTSNILDIHTATHTLTFDNGTVLKSFIHATAPIGYFEIEGVHAAHAVPSLVPHQYQSTHHDAGAASVVSGQNLSRLGYSQGKLVSDPDQQRIHQATYDGKYFEVLLQWKQVSAKKVTGFWTITNNTTATLETNIGSSFLKSHQAWWQEYWSRSSVSIPDPLLEKQYYLDIYKLGAVARPGAPAITLQAIWTADNGGLPPWKGDFHNDLNTQLSYWPAYTSNHLSEAKTFTDWLWKVRPENLKYTKQYFGVEGLNIPGVLTLNGYPMGGWIQYSLSPTVSAWTAQHFYWQWKYSMDDDFLKSQAYPYIIEAATFLKNISYLKDGKRYIPLSSSPEYNDNRVDAWFSNWTNFDLGLAHFIFSAAAEVSTALDQSSEATTWLKIKKELPDFAADESGILVAVHHAMEHSHRHMSPYMAIYPLSLLDINNAADHELITRSLRHLESLGTKAWVGYSFGWMACLHARAKQSEQAVTNLQRFASNFCSINSFHLNGDQKGGQYSGFTYRPFTLEGNFAFAQGIHELLLQSKSGYIEIFPATPSSWQDVSFDDLRTEGGFLVSAAKSKGRLRYVKIKATHSGVLRIKEDSLVGLKLTQNWAVKKDGYYTFTLKKGQTIELKANS